MEHTPTPWRVIIFPDGSDCFVQADRNNPTDPYDIEILGDDTNPNFYPISQKMADAERIVACVNACEGIPNDKLPRLHEMLDDGTAALDACVRLEHYMKELLRFAANDFIPGYGMRSKEYTVAFNDALQEMKKRDREFDPFKYGTGIRSSQEATS